MICQCLVAICAVHGIFMDRLASKKLCADDECVYTISLARAQEDYNAPDCRFINVKKGQRIYVYSKLVKENEAGEFWAGSVYANQSGDEMGTVGYFPSNLVQEQHVYQEATKEVPTTVSVSGAGERGEKDSECRCRQVYKDASCNLRAALSKAPHFQRWHL
uniref:Otoraplin n=1 Tax=Capra hircus TaxID=9925 RepID=A0A8C2PFH6_CAPHI